MNKFKKTLKRSRIKYSKKNKRSKHSRRRKSLKRSKKSRRKSSKRSRRKSLKRPRKYNRSLIRLKKFIDGMKKHEIELTEPLYKQIETKSLLLRKYLYENVGRPSHFRDFTENDIGKFVGIWIKIFPHYDKLNDELFDNIYKYYVDLKSFEAEEELFPTDYDAIRKEYEEATSKNTDNYFNIGDIVYYNWLNTDPENFNYRLEPKYIITKISINGEYADISQSYIDKSFFAGKEYKDIPLSKLLKSPTEISMLEKVGSKFGLF